MYSRVLGCYVHIVEKCYVFGIKSISAEHIIKCSVQKDDENTLIKGWMSCSLITVPQLMQDIANYGHSTNHFETAEVTCRSKMRERSYVYELSQRHDEAWSNYHVSLIYRQTVLH